MCVTAVQSTVYDAHILLQTLVASIHHRISHVIFELLATGWVGMEVLTGNKMHRLVPRPSPASDLDCLQYSKMARKGLGDRITCNDIRG